MSVKYLRDGTLYLGSKVQDITWKPSTIEHGHKTKAIKVSVEVVSGFALSESGETFDITRWIGLVGLVGLLSSSGWKHVMRFHVFVVFPKHFSLVRHIVHVVVLVQVVVPSTSWPKCFHTLFNSSAVSCCWFCAHCGPTGAAHQHYVVKEHLENKCLTFVDAAAQMMSSFCLTDMQNWSEGFWMFPGLSYHRAWSVTRHSDVIKDPKCTDTNRFINNRKTRHVEVDARSAVGLIFHVMETNWQKKRSEGGGTIFSGGLIHIWCSN